MSSTALVIQAFRPNSDGDTWRYTTEARWIHIQRCVVVSIRGLRSSLTSQHQRYHFYPRWNESRMMARELRRSLEVR